MTDYTILPIEEKYINSFRAALDVVAKEHKYLAFLEAPPMEQVREFVLNNIKNNWPQFVAISNNQVVGWCDISALDRPVYNHRGSLGIGVVPGYRGKGIGEALMRTALESAKSKGLTRVELYVRENNQPAFSLYKKLGFQVEGLHRNAVRIGEQYENYISMAILFPD